MLRFLIFVLILLCKVPTIYGQDTRYSSLITFESRLDSLLFTGHSLSLVEQFMAIKPGITEDRIGKINTQISAFCDQFRKLNWSKNRVKQLQTLFEKTHEVFLKRYREQIFFPSIFENGEFNCVTASMLYVLILEELQLPYAIIEEPNHVFVIVYPSEDYVIFETTSPVFKEQQIPLKQRQALVENGLKYKMITIEERDSLGLNGAFEQLSHRFNRVSMKQLIGFQYSNRMAYFKCESDYTRCIQNGLRSLSFLENEEMKQAIHQLVVTQFVSKKFKDLSLYRAFIMLASEREIDPEVLAGLFEELLETYYDEEEFDWIFNTENYIQELVINEAAKAIYLEVLYGFIYSFFDDDELPTGDLETYRSKLEAINPNSEYLEEEEYYYVSVNKPTQELLDLFDEFKFEEIRTKLGELEEESKLKSINLKQLESGMSKHVDDLIYKRDVNNAQKCMKFMFELEEEFEDFKIDSYKMGYNYLYLGDHYLDKGNKTMAKKILKEGYDHFPAHAPLKARYLHVTK